MLRFPSWKIALILGICLVGFVLSLPNLFPREQMQRLPDWLPHDQINLGLDLQGGSHLLLEVDIRAVVEERLETLVDDIRSILRPARIGYRGLGVRGDAATLTLTDPADAGEAVALLDDLNPNPLARELEVVEGEGGRIEARLTESAVRELQDSAVRQSLEIVRRRIDEVGTREPTIQRQGEDRILVQVPGEKDPESIKRLLGQTAKLTFHLVDLDTPLQQALAGNLPPGSMLLPSTEEGQGQMVVRKRVEVSGESLVDAQPTFQQNEPVVSFRFDSAGGAQVRQRHPRARRRAAGHRARRQGDQLAADPRADPRRQRRDLRQLHRPDAPTSSRCCCAPARCRRRSRSSRSARSGPISARTSIAAGEIAGVVALVLVIGLMSFYYGLFGVAACIALLVNLVLIIGVLSALQATLTLPGIAGIVLTIGMAVDANVLIFERIREEVRGGRSPISAIDAGYREAMRTIIDANLTTLIAAVLLYAFGSGPVRGFAVTLGIGIITSMFTAISLTRLMVASWLRRTRPAALPV